MFWFTLLDIINNDNYVLSKINVKQIIIFHESVRKHTTGAILIAIKKWNLLTACVCVCVCVCKEFIFKKR